MSVFSRKALSRKLRCYKFNRLNHVLAYTRTHTQYPTGTPSKNAISLQFYQRNTATIVK